MLLYKEIAASIMPSFVTAQAGLRLKGYGVAASLPHHTTLFTCTLNRDHLS
jgi:hypothetical protein